jgi:menaquinol-cytochrome c reductase iron-sulfur subunit
MTCCCEGPKDPDDKQSGLKNSEDSKNLTANESPGQSLGAVFPDWKKIFVSRQEFLKALSLGLGAFIVSLPSLPLVGFMFNYFIMPKREGWVSVGPVEKFKTGETVNVSFENPDPMPYDGVSAKNSAWLRRNSEDKFQAWAINCTHLGCPVRWEAGAGLFLCPCHGGVFDSSGDVAGGPPPRPMHRYPVRVANGQVQIAVRPVLSEG